MISIGGSKAIATCIKLSSIVFIRLISVQNMLGEGVKGVCTLSVTIISNYSCLPKFFSSLSKKALVGVVGGGGKGYILLACESDGKCMALVL